MADILSLQTPYEDNQTVTSDNLNNLVKQASFTDAAVDGVTTQLSGKKIIVCDTAITKQKLAVSMQGALELTGTAYIGGDKTGATRGDQALDIQSDRGTNTSNVASGARAIAIGRNNISSGGNSTALGQSCSATGENTVAVGTVAKATALRTVAIGSATRAVGAQGIAIGNNVVQSGTSSIAIGNNANVTTSYGLAIGSESEATGTNTIAVGRNIKNTGSEAAEFGAFTSAGDRAGSIRAQGNGAISLTMLDATASPTDGGATAGSETNGTLGRGMFMIQKGVTDIGGGGGGGTPPTENLVLFYNDGGIIKHLVLGDLTS